VGLSSGGQRSVGLSCGGRCVRRLEPPAPWHARASLESHGAGGWACSPNCSLTV
jgi:hypothetical protein